MTGLSEQDRNLLARVEYAEWHAMGEHFDPAWADHLLPTVEQIVARHVAAALTEAADAIEAVDEVTWALAGMHAGVDAADIVRSRIPT